VTVADIDAVLHVLSSDFLTQGPSVPRFEEAVALHVGAKHAVAVNSATSALHLACLALGLGPGDWLWTSPITFVASANCALYCGARVDFVDIDPRTYTMSVERLEEKLILAKRVNKLPKVVVPVHMCGQPCDMNDISSLSKKYGFHIIEDASHAIGGRYLGEPIGNGKHGDITVFSFHPAKIITTGEGGVAVTNDAQLAERMTILRSHGITRDPNKMTHASDGAWYYQQIELGFNYRMTDIHAALGLSQMARVDEYVSRRHMIARNYDDRLSSLPVTLPWQCPDRYSGMHLYVIRLQLNLINSSHIEIFNSLRDRGVGVNLHYIPVYRQPYYKRFGFKLGDFPESERYYAEAISLPMFAGLTDEQQDTVIAAVGQVLAA
jgi:UDP-4-amino-4,6-dideoxy-N-acetyl-beta-L-altrosamine transaminase